MLKKLITGAAIMGTLMTAGRGHSADSIQELIRGQKTTTVDTKLMGKLAPKVGIFARNIATIDQEEKVKTFGVVDISYPIGKGVDVVGEAQLSPQSGFVPRVGLQYFKEEGDLSTYLASTVPLTKPFDSENVIALQYRPKLSDSLGLFTSLENVTNFGKEGHNFSAQKIRLGLETKGYQFGIAADLLETGKKPKVSSTIGAFVRKEF
ncbi:hypothetical protein CL622_08190 [archaeon]|nr:hypothetical protein [archaeon]|tara:strand:+ start:1544 stop:2164 length:621 start_codon:yes stop_codon:yes gene_type:complete